MGYLKNIFLFLIAFNGIDSGYIFANAAVFLPDTGPAVEQPPEQQLPIPPRGCINNPKKITFDHSLNVDSEYPFDDSQEFFPGSKEDKEASQWYVVTREGYEYEGSPDVLESIFEAAHMESLMQAIFGSDDQAQRFKRSVFPPDTRTKVSDLERFPYSAMGRIRLGCTGTFVGPRHILTAGHCVYNFRRQRWHDQLDFNQGKSCDPDQGRRFTWNRALTVRGWMREGRRVYDYGLIVVNEESDNIMDYGYYRDTRPFTINIAGYPGDKKGRCMWRTSCQIKRWYMEELGYQCDTYPGMSGSGVYAYWPASNKRLIFCVHAYGSGSRGYNSCTRITNPRVQQIKMWIQDN